MARRRLIEPSHCKARPAEMPGRMRRRPDDSGEHVENLETDHPHVHHPGDPRDDRLDTWNEAADDDALSAMLGEIGLTCLEQAAIARERPDFLQPIAVDVTNPEGYGIAGDRPEKGGDEHRPERQLAKTDQAADGDQRCGARDEQPDDQQRFAHGNEKGCRHAESRVAADVIESALGEFGQGDGSAKGGALSFSSSAAIHQNRWKSKPVLGCAGTCYSATTNLCQPLAGPTKS